MEDVFDSQLKEIEDKQRELRDQAGLLKSRKFLRSHPKVLNGIKAAQELLGKTVVKKISSSNIYLVVGFSIRPTGHINLMLLDVEYPASPLTGEVSHFNVIED